MSEWQCTEQIPERRESTVARQRQNFFGLCIVVGLVVVGRLDMERIEFVGGST